MTRVRTNHDHSALTYWMGYLCLTLLLLPAQAEEPSVPIPDDWHVDRTLYPAAYGLLANEKLMLPVDMADWPVKIDASHQLFVDDYLVAGKENVVREVHQARKHPANPVLIADKPWERMEEGQPGGAVFQIVRRDEATSRFRMWYAGYTRFDVPDGVSVRFPALYAESVDGVTWEKPNLGLHEFNGSKDNNIVIPAGNLYGLIYEPDHPDPDRRYEGIVWHEPDYVPREGYFLYTSPDGIHWTREREEPLAISLSGYTMPQTGIGDTSIFRWDRLLGKYMGDVKFVLPGKFRCRGMMESDDLVHWTPPRMTIYPDALDASDSQVYGHLSFCYESMWLGFLRVMHTDIGWKQTTVELAASRDGRHWYRIDSREQIIPLGGDSDWDADYHDPCWDPILVGDELWIYYRSLSRRPGDGNPNVGHAIGLATLRRDGFVSLNAGDEAGTVVTRPLNFADKTLFVNAEVGEGGWVKAGLLSADGEPVASCSLADCVPLTRDTTAGQLTWVTAPAMPVLGRDEHIRIRFALKNAKLYAFWAE